MNISSIPLFSGSYRTAKLQKTNAEENNASKTEKSTSTQNAASSSTKNTSSLPDAVVEQIQSMAREGASQGVYMGEKYAAFCKEYKQANITPDYSQLKSSAMSMLNQLKQAPYTGENIFGQLFGFSFEMGAGVTQDFISIKDKSGDTVLIYDSRQGWINWSSKAENAFHKEAAAIYSKEYSAARAEMKTQASSDNTAATEVGANFEMRA